MTTNNSNSNNTNNNTKKAQKQNNPDPFRVPDVYEAFITKQTHAISD